jgi:hypothetical protein
VCGGGGGYHANHLPSLDLMCMDCSACMLELLAKVCYFGVLLGVAFHEHLLRVRGCDDEVFHELSGAQCAHLSRSWLRLVVHTMITTDGNFQQQRLR